MINHEKLLQSLEEMSLTISKLVTIVSNDMSGKPTAEIDRNLILSTVANFYRMSSDELIAKDRTRSLSRKRQMAMVLCRQYTTASLHELGSTFGFDHTTILHAMKNWEKYTEQDQQLNDDYQALKQYFESKAERTQWQAGV